MRKSLSHSELTSENKQIDHEVKIVQKQIVLAEKSLASLLKDFSNITVDLNRLHTRQKELCESLSFISNEESPILGECLDFLASHLCVILESLQKNINVLQNQVINPFSEKAKNCKDARTILSKCSDARKQHRTAIKALGKSSMRCDERDETYAKTALESTKKVNELTSEMIHFEKSKAKDLKCLLKTYMHSNLAYHVKAVEQYTKAYQVISMVDVDQHVQHFIDSLTVSKEQERGKFVKWHSFTSLKT